LFVDLRPNALPPSAISQSSLYVHTVTTPARDTVIRLVSTDPRQEAPGHDQGLLIGEFGSKVDGQLVKIKLCGRPIDGLVDAYGYAHDCPPMSAHIGSDADGGGQRRGSHGIRSTPFCGAIHKIH
jgi:hypothetical protein